MRNVVFDKKCDQVVSITIENGNILYYCGVEVITPLQQLAKEHDISSLAKEEIIKLRKNYQKIKRIKLSTNKQKAVHYKILPSYKLFQKVKTEYQNNNVIIV